MSPASGPTVRRRQLGAELRRLREKAGKKIEDVAAHLECSQSKVSRVETGQAPIKARDVRDLLGWYGVDDAAQVEAVMQIHKDAQQQGWWAQFDDVLPSGMSTYAGLESDAVSLRSFEPFVMHGLLQTEPYIRALMDSGNPMDQTDIEQLVKFRLRRQQMLERPSGPLELWVVLEETVLRRPVGGKEVMLQQLDHLIEVAALPNVTIQIMPLAKGAHAAMVGAFTLMDFGQMTPTVIYVESAAGNIYLEKERDVRRFTQSFDLLRAAAPDPQQTTALLKGIAREMQKT
ncbi:putative transcriptional regulator [Streptomyces sp. NBRC 110611]|uniref:helix-turn-helix domain-containing protein n=1 Tax=Streptomyces sp. NBRC 110611 TaxID=1621259 RepID=UPI00082D1B76|nr:helix-turn-helix transcriptional regulator [Streptomyces sp. NBRC 110611]GAU70649.1 putative transcriptional regulator [Streptomyces sp. NBRC 110611]